MITLISDKLPELARLCREYGVSRLEVFGSAATGDFDSEASDIDFLIEFEDNAPLSFNHYFGFQEAAKSLFGREVDVVINAEFRNPYFREAVDESRELVYESTGREVPV